MNLLLIASLFFADTAVYPLSETFADSVEPWYKQTADWMGFVRDDAQVWELTMPASHDAGMSDTATRGWYDPFDEFYSAQYGPLSEQLAAGVRYFDLRPCPDGDVIKAWHGQKVAGVYWDRFGETFADMLDDAREFLEAHRSETVFYHIGHWSGDGQDAEKVKADVLDMITSGYSDILFKTSEKLVLNHVPLGDLRGKLVIVCENVSGNLHEKGIWGCWTLGSDGHNEDVVTGVPCHEGFLNIYNNYSDKGDFTPMAETQRVRWESNCCNRVNWGFMLNWTLTFDWAGIKSGAEAINPKLKDDLKTYVPKYGRPFLVNCDYNEAGVCSDIIRYNAEALPAHCRDAKGQVIVDSDIRPAKAQVWGMSVDGFDILPNESMPSQTVVIARGVIPEAVTVRLTSRRIDSIDLNDARLSVVRDGTDITRALDIPRNGSVADIRNAGVADWVREQLFDTKSGTGCGLVRTTSGGKDCLLWTIPTHRGLDYVVSTGRTLDGLKKTGIYKGTNDNLSLPLTIEPGTTSGFMSVDVTWGLE